MNVSETRWKQGHLVIHVGARDIESASIAATKIIRETDYALLQMLGKIARRSTYSNWPFPGGNHA